MNKKSLAYSGLLILGLVMVSILLNRGSVLGVHNNGDLDLTVDTSQYLLGQPITFNATLDFAVDEEADIHQARLVVSGPQPLDVVLPLSAVTDFDLSGAPGVTGELRVTSTFTGLTPIGSTLPGSTLPGGTLPADGGFKGSGTGGSITYEITWTPPVFLDPPPIFTLIPNVDTLFAIPQLSPPDAQTGTVLPDTDLVFAIPTVGAPPGTLLPNLDFAFNIPQVSVSTNAATGLLDLPATSQATDGFNIPDLQGLGLVPSPPSGVAEYPASSNAFSIPDLSSLIDTAPGGEPDLPTTALSFVVPGSAAPGGIASDGTDFWVISKGTGPAGRDQIVKVNSSGAVVTGWATSGFLDGPSNSLDGITHLDSSLWIVENSFRCNDAVEPDRCDRNHRIFEVPLASLPSSDADWGALSRLGTTDQFDDMGGITAQGAGTSGTLWLANKFGWRFYNISQSGVEIDTPFADPSVTGIDGIAYSEGFLYTSKAGVISQWKTNGRKVQDFSTSLTNLKGLAFISRVLYMARANGNVFAAFVGESVTTTPRGIAISTSSDSVGEAVWILVDGSPFDKLMKVDTTTGALITNFSTDGFQNAPSNKTEGMTFLGGTLYIVANENNNAKLYAVNATTGATTATFDLQTTAQVWDDIGGITNDGTSLVLHTKSFFNSVFIIDPATGLRAGLEQAFPCCPSFNGAKGLAYHSGRDQYFAANNAAVVSYDGNFEVNGEQSVTESGSPLSSIQGLAFNGDLLIIAHGSGVINKSFLATNVTTKPKGLAFTPSSSTAGTALWALVDAEPLDKLMKIDPATGLLISTFGTNGFVDAPSNKTDGITFLDTGSPSTSFLWIISNEQSGIKLYKINTNTGATVSTFNLQSTAQIWDDIGGISNDGTNLVLYGRTFGSVFVLDPSNATRTGVEQAFPCCSTTFGAKAMAYHSGRSQFFAAKDNKLFRLSTNLNNFVNDQTVLADAAPVSNIEGMAFDQDVLYIARNDSNTGRVSVGALRTSVGTNPRGLAFTPTGTNVNGVLVDKALWVLVDGDPADKLLKVDADTGSLITAFGTDGAVDTPDDRTQGITFFSNSLWIISDGNFGAMLYQINPATGALTSTVNLGNCPNPCSFFDPPGGIDNDGTNLIVFNRNFNQVVYIDTSGDRMDENFPFAPSFDGGMAVAFRSDENQLFAARNSDIVRFVQDGSELFVSDEFDTSPTALDIRGMVFDNGTAGDPQDDRLFIANKNTNGEIYSAGIPSTISNDPIGLAYDSIGDELYILVNGKGEASDHVIVVNPTTGAAIRDFTTDAGETGAITYLNGSLYIAVENFDFGFGGTEILELDPATGVELNFIDTSSLPGRILGLANDGTDLIASPEFGGPHVLFLNPSNGFTTQEVFFFDPFGGFFAEGFEAVAYRDTGDPEFFPVKFDTAFRFGEHGRLIEEFDIGATGVNGIRGAVFVSDLLYVADVGSNSVRSAAIPIPPTVITNDPRGLASDGTDLYVIVDATPNDKIIKMDSSTGALITSFGDQGAADSPGGETDGIVFHNERLFVVTNDERISPDPFGGPGFVDVRPLIHELDTTTGEEIQRMDILIEDFFGPPFLLNEPIGGLASDGVDLFAGIRGDFGFQGVWFVINPDDPGAPAQIVDEFAGSFAFMPGFQSMTFTDGDQFDEGRRLVAAGGFGAADTISRMDAQNGAMRDQLVIPGTDITGLAYQGLTLFMADAATNSILGTALPENTVEQTIVGNYSSQIEVDVSLSLTKVGGPALFDVIRNPEVLVQLTTIGTVKDGQVPLVEGFILTETTANINGLVNDPSVLEIEAGIALPFTLLLDDPVDPDSGDIWDIDSETGGAAQWHIDESNRVDRVSSLPSAWRFGVPGGPNFSTGDRAQGTLTSVDAIEINPGTELIFWTGFITELGAETDLKMVDVAVVTQDLQGNDVVGEFRPLLQIVGKGGGFAPPPGNAWPEFQFVDLEPLYVFPNLVPVHADLSPFAGQDIMVQFRFDSIDPFANEGEGWYLDDIAIAGQGVKSVVVPTTLLVPPDTTTVPGQTFYRSFSLQNFELAEGENFVGAQGKQPYSPFEVGFMGVSGFVDQTAPFIDLFGIPGSTSDLLQTLQGSIEDATFQSMEITQIKPDLSSVVIFETNSMPSEGEFSIPVSLVEGTNRFEATVTDGGGLQSTASLSVIADITPPTATVAIVTVTSENEAVVGDQFFVVVAATDNLSGIAMVLEEPDGGELTEIGAVPTILVAMHGLDSINGAPVSHVNFGSVQPGTPVGENQFAVKVIDNAGNEAIAQGSLSIVSARSNRNYFLFPGVNFVGLGLTPDDPSIDRVLNQEVDPATLNEAFLAAQTVPDIGDTDAPSGANIGDTVIAVTDGSGFAAGDAIVIGTGTGAELMSVVSVATNDLTVDTALVNTHATGAPVIEVIEQAGDTAESLAAQGALQFGTTTTSAFAGIGDVTIDVLDASGFAAGDMIVIDFGSGGELRGIDGVSGLTLTLDEALEGAWGVGASVNEVKPRLADVIESTFAFNDAGNFIVHSPGDGAADTLTQLEPFQGMIIRTTETVDDGGTDVAVFKQVNVEGFTAQQAVPVRMNISGLFFPPGQLPPSKTLRFGYNLIAPHILGDTTFNVVYLAAQDLAVNAITFERRVDAVDDEGGIGAEIFEGFIVNSLEDLLKPVLSYWTFVVQDDPVNPTTPSITLQ